MRFRAGRRRGSVLVPLAAGAIAAALGAAGCSSSAPDVPAVHVACPNVSHKPPPRPGNLIFGLNSVWNDACNLASIRAAGVTMERLEIAWSDIEPRRGHWDWRAPDHEVTAAAKGGVTVLPLLMALPSWLHQGQNTIPADPRGYADYVARVVSRYGPDGDFWHEHPKLPYHPALWFELWNEPYLPQFSTGGAKPEAYARMVKAAVIAGRKARPAARFLMAADLTGLLPDGNGSVDWIGALYRAVPDLNNYFDGVAVHPYTGTVAPNFFGSGTPKRFEFRRIELIHDLFAAHGALNKPFWITEIGWSTCPDNPSDCVSDATQAAYLRQVFDAVKQKYSSWVRAVFVYNYRDSPQASSPSDKERWFGLIRRNGSPKPSWGVLSAEAR